MKLMVPASDMSRVRSMLAIGAFAVVLALAGCGTAAPPEGATSRDAAQAQGASSEPAPSVDDESKPEPADEKAPDEQPQDAQAETCDWDSPRISPAAQAPAGQEGELTEVLVGSWQHTHTDGGSGFEPVVNDHRFVFPAPERMLYCQHVPGATDHAENAANVVLNGTKIELPGGKYGYTVTAWDENTMVWNNPVGGGYIYLLQRR